MNKLKRPAIGFAIALIAIVGFAYSGIYDVSAGSSHSSMVNWLLSTTSHASIERRAKGIEVPNLNDDALARAGVNDFNGMCAGCHGAPGREPEAMGQGLNPPAPDIVNSDGVTQLRVRYSRPIHSGRQSHSQRSRSRLFISTSQP